MDNLECNVSTFASTTTLSPWSNQLAGGGAALFDPLQDQLHQITGQTPNVGMNFGRLSKVVHQSMYPTTTTTTAVPNFNDNSSSYDGSSSVWFNGDYMATNNPSLDILVQDFGLAHNQLKSLNHHGFTFTQDGIRPRSTTKTASLESFECLLSTTNSNTAGASQDDGISILVSNGRKVLSFGSPTATTLSSANSQTSSDQNFATRSVSLEATNRNPRSNKRSSKQNELQFGGKIQNFDVISSDSSTAEEGGFKLIEENNNPPKSKRPRSDNKTPSSTNINFQQPSSSVSSVDQEPDAEAIAKMKEMIYRAAAFRPVNLGLEVIQKPKRKNVRISSDPQTVAARQRRERISDRIRVLQKLVPGGTKMDTATMLDEAANYLKFLSSQVKALENFGHKLDEPVVNSTSCSPYPTTTTNLIFSSNHSFPKHNHFPHPNPNSMIHHPQR